MKRVVLIIILINLFIASGCGLTKVDPAEGRQLAESLLQDRMNGNYDRIGTYYISSYMARESEESMVNKYRKIEEAAGSITAYELVSESQRYDEGSSYHQLTLVYKVTCSRATLRETFIIVKDEGHTGIISQQTENWDLDA